jgi:hypothetical protein
MGSQMRASELFSSGGVQIGTYAQLPYTSDNLITMNGVSLLRTGVIALQSAYPLLPQPGFSTMPPAVSVTTNIANITVLAASPTLFVGVTASTNPAQFVSSPDGQTWTLRGDCTKGGTVNAPSIMCWTGTVFVAASNTANGMWTSPDGQAWTGRSNATPAAGLTSMVGNGASILMASSSGSYQYSTDSGVTWSQAALPGAGTSSPMVAYFAGVFCLLSYAAGIGTLYTSPASLTAWTARSTGLSSNTNILTGNGFALINAGASVAKSTDAINWTVSVVPDQALNVNGGNLGFANGVFFSFPENGAAISTSTDGIKWRKSHAAYIGTALSNNTKMIFSNGTNIALTKNAINGTTTLTKFTVPATYVDNFTFITAPSTPANALVAYLRVA